MEKNIVFFGPAPFPNGFASTKRWVNIIQYLNQNAINSKLIITKHNSFEKFNNPVKGQLGYTTFEDFSPFWQKNKSLIKYYKALFNKMKEFYELGKCNFLIFPSFISPSFIPIMIYAKKIGYKILFDKMEDISIIKSKGIINKLKVILIKFIDNYAIKRASGIITISSFLYNDYKNKAKKILMLPNSTKIFLNNEKHSDNLSVKILFSGTFDEKNGVHLLIDAVRELYNEGFNLRLNIIGIQSGRFFNSYFDKYKNSNYIHFHGFVSEEKLEEFLIISDILAVTRINSRSAKYGFPFKLSEYLSTGKPVLCSKVGDVCQYVSHLENAFLVEPNNSHEIYKGLKYFFQNPELAQEIGRKGKLVADKFFNININGKMFVEFLDTLVK
jgi:glycosyltransferase involved in cell wall biosynthesis